MSANWSQMSYSAANLKPDSNWNVIMNRLALAALALALMAPQAFAGACMDDIAKIDKAMEKSKLAADQQQEVLDLREQAVQLCGAGNEQQGLDQTAQAKQILNID